MMSRYGYLFLVFLLSFDAVFFTITEVSTTKTIHKKDLISQDNKSSGKCYSLNA